MYLKEAQEKCPDLVIVKGEDLTHYREMSYQVTGMMFYNTESKTLSERGVICFEHSSAYRFTDQFFVNIDVIISLCKINSCCDLR